MTRKCSIGIAVLLSASGVFAHGGGLNAEGCHNNRKTGDYHCHRAQLPRPASPNPISPPANRLVPDRGGPLPPTCHVGPRGGRYTISPSGRKNYGAC